MKPSSWVAPLFALVSSVACSANDTGSPASTGGSTSSSTGGASSSTGGQVASSTGGSTSSSTGGSQGGGITLPPQGGGSAGGEENCGLQNFNLVREPADVLLVLDRSASMEDAPDGATDATSKWNLVVPALVEVVTATGGGVAWGMKTYPEGEGSECIAGSVTDKIDVAVAGNNAAAVNAAIMGTTPKGNGTPTGDAVKQAVTYMKTLTSTHPKFLLLATDGEPSCAGTTKGSEQARPYAVQAVTDALAAGFPTYVVGVATTKKSATEALNNMATAGGKPRADANPLATRYYLANTKQELVDSLTAITGEVNQSCVFTLNPPPPSPEFIAVKVTGTSVAQDTSKVNGWDYTAADFSRLEVFGKACDDIKNASAGKVEIIYGCKNNPPR
jgi:hypothetical protein